MKRLFLLLCAIGVLFSPAAHTEQRTVDTVIVKREADGSWPAPEWAKEAWTGSDRPYVKIRREIDKAIASRRLTRAILSTLKNKALKQPKDPIAQFRWVYAVQNAHLAGIYFNVPYITMDEAGAALARPASPHSYEYARLRFFIASRQQIDPQYISLGQRLLRRNPKDYGVKFHLTQTLGSGTPAQRKQALDIAQELVRQYPKKASAHSALALVYLDRWNVSHDVADADKAIAGYRKYLQLELRDKRSRQGVQSLIKAIEREKAEREKA